MSAVELERFLTVWDAEAQKTTVLLKSLPTDQYDFRPDPDARSLGELAWHLAEVEGYMSFGAERGKFEVGMKVPGLERPRTVEELAPGYERVHADSVARVRRLAEEDLARPREFFGGRQVPLRDILWSAILLHEVHHRGQLSVLMRLAKGTVPGLYGPNREESKRLAATR